MQLAGMDFDIGIFADDVAKQFGFEDVSDAARRVAVNEARGQIQRLVDKPGQDVKQTPPVNTPSAYVQDVLSQLPFEVKVSPMQALAIGAIGLGLVAYLVVRR